MAETAKTAAKGDTKFPKEQLIGALKFANRRDLLSALLEDGKCYTIEEAKKIMDNYLKRKVI